MNITDEELRRLPSVDQTRTPEKEKQEAWDAYRYAEREKLKEALAKRDSPPTAPPEDALEDAKAFADELFTSGNGKAKHLRLFTDYPENDGQYLGGYSERVVEQKVAKLLHDRDRKTVELVAVLNQYADRCERGYCGHAHRGRKPECHVEGCPCVSFENRAFEAMRSVAKKDFGGGGE